MIKCVVFDADGVVINFKYFTIELEKQHGISHEKVQSFFEKKFNGCLIGKKDLKKEIAPYLLEWGWKKTVDDFLDFWFKTEDRPNILMINFINLLRSKKYPIILATNQEKYRTKFMIKEMKFDKLFDDIISSADAKSKKPSVEFFTFLFKQIEQKYGIKREDVVFWDDAKENVVAATDFGFKSFEYKNFKHFKKIMNSLCKPNMFG